MAHKLALDLTEKNLLTDQIILDLSFSHDTTDTSKPPKNFSLSDIKEKAHLSHGSKSLTSFTNSSHLITEATLYLLQKLMPEDTAVRRVNITANHITHQASIPFLPLKQLDLFDTPYKTEQQTEQDQRLQQATIAIQARYGKNALILGTNFRPEATMRERNKQIGGHRAS